MTKTRLHRLSEAYLDNTISPLEWEELKAYLLTGAEHSEFSAELGEALEKKEYELADQAILDNILKKVFVAAEQKNGSRTAHRVRFLKTTWFRYAAAIFLLAGALTIAFVLYSDRQRGVHSTADNHIKTSIRPGGDKAILTLGDGRQIVLDSAANGQLASQGGVQVMKLANGQIIYDMQGVIPKDMMLNTMATPKGGQYQVTLPDGTRVWLNAASSITFPTIFPDGKRQVKVSGEVYMEVAKNDRKPFYVDINGQSTIQVLGTSFNINAYTDEDNVKTTLLEGRVKVINTPVAVATGPGAPAAKGPAAASIILKPGQMAVRNSKEMVVKEGADVSQILAWKDGLFNFNGLELKSVMRQLERWYDIDVKYEGTPASLVFRGEMYRNADLSDVLEMLKKMGVNFRMQGKTLVLME